MQVVNVMSDGFDTQFYINAGVLSIRPRCRYDFPLCLRTLPLPSRDSRRNYSFGFLLTYKLQTCYLPSTRAADFMMSSPTVPPSSISCTPKSISWKTSCLPISLLRTVSLFWKIMKMRGTMWSSTCSFNLRVVRSLMPIAISFKMDT